MFRINENYLKLGGSYLFSTVGRKAREFQAQHPEVEVISLGIGDVTEPLCPAVIKALHEAVEEMGHAESFHGYAPDLGYVWLRECIAKNDYAARGARITPDEIFVSDGAKSDAGAIQELFSLDARIAVCDPVYPVYVDSNVMAGRTGAFDAETGRYGGVLYMPCRAENGFSPSLPEEAPDVIYLCYPNNPTGMGISKEKLQNWVDYANSSGAVILYDAAYEAYITGDLPHSIYECDGAESCAIELRSFSKNAGFTGTRLGFTVIPKALVRGGVSLHDLWARRHGTRYNGAPYIVQKAGMAVYSEEGKAQIREQIGIYQKNARLIREGLSGAGYTVYGGVDAPYIWLKTPGNMSSWDFFDLLLNQAGVVGTPGSGFGPSGEGYFRLTAFGSPANTEKAVKRIQSL